MAKQSPPPMQASAASPSVSSRPAAWEAPPAERRATPSPLETDLAKGRLKEAIFRPTLNEDGEAVVRILPPTLYNLTHPKEEDQVSQSNRHYRILDPTDDVLRRKVERLVDGAGVFSDLMIYWPDPSMESSSPDVFVVFGLRRPPAEIETSFKVAQEGVVPCLVFEVVSATYKESLAKDYDFNTKHYAKAGVRELVLVEPVTEGSPRIRRLLVFRLTASGTYRQVQPDVTGRFLLRTVGFKIHVEKDALVMEDAATGERFLTSWEEEDARKEEALARKEAERSAEEAVRARKEAERRAERSRAEALLTVLGACGFVLSEQVRERILATTDVKTLDLWLGRAVTASSLDEVLAENG